MLLTFNENLWVSKAASSIKQYSARLIKLDYYISSVS